MAIKHQTSENETQTASMGLNVSYSMPEQVSKSESSGLANQPKAKRIDLTMVSLVAAMIAIQLTLMIALITPKAPVPPKLLESAVIEQPVQVAPAAATLELPSIQSVDKRFMNGLEVEPAPPSASDPFSVRGNKAK
jgi:hypothetical protein